MGTKLPRHMVVLDEATTKRVQQYKERNGIQSTSKALSELIRAGLREYLLAETGALRFADVYNQLDEHGRKVLNSIADLELERCQKQRQVPPTPRVPIFKMPYFPTTVSAGLGNPLDESTAEIVELIKQPPENASFLLMVDGDSMEPRIPDGALVFIEKTEDVDFGDIGVVVNGGDVFLKRLERNGLVSLNQSYPPIHPLEDFRVLGRFISIADDTYFP